MAEITRSVGAGGDNLRHDVIRQSPQRDEIVRAIMPPASRLTVRAKIGRYLFGHDVFISYGPADGRGTARITRRRIVSTDKRRRQESASDCMA